MKNGLTNLLPEYRVRDLRISYWMHLGTLALIMVSALLISAVLLRAPLYLYERQQLAAAQSQLDDLNKQLIESGGGSAGSRLKKLNADAAALTKLATSTQAVTGISAVLRVPHPGIQINAISYVAPVKGPDGRVVISGTSATRETLRAYTSALSGQSFISNVDLPISAYAKDSAIPFTVTLTGTFQP